MSVSAVFVAVLVAVLAAASAQEAEESSCTLPNCDECVNPDLYCEACNYGYVPSEDGTSCLECSDNCDSCVEKGGSAICEECSAGFYQTNDGIECGRCSSKCSDCGDGSDGCESCMTGYHLLSDSLKCPSCSANCMECVDGNVCLRCQDRFYLQDSGYMATCQACPGGITDCMMCTDGSKCDQCVFGKFWDGSKCADCTDDCAECDNPDTCITCMSGYVLSSDSLCDISSTHCTAYTHGTGCTECNQNYLLKDNRCVKCPDLQSAATCNACVSENQARVFNDATGQCEYCPDECVACSDPDSCSKCVDGKVWKDGSGCVSCSDNPASLDENNCDMCEDFYFDTTCQACPATLAEMDSESKCVECEGSELGHLWTDGVCESVDCSGMSLTEADCDLCIKKEWDGDSCEDVVCDELNSAERCAGCSTDDAMKYWTPPKCEELLCTGLLTDATLCDSCSNRYFDGTTCTAIDCSTAGDMRQRDQCESCPGYVFTDDNECVVIDCSDLNVLDSEEKCHACRQERMVNWVEDITSCVETDCTGVADLKEVGCLSCMLNDPSQILKWSGTACERMADTACSGRLSDDSEADLAFLCTACPHMYWDDANGACEASNCEVAISDPDQCNSCQGKMWNTDTTACDSVDCSGVLDSEDKCAACEGHVWENSECRPVSCDQDLSAGSEAECNSCKNWKHIPGECGDVDCSDVDNLDMYACVTCGLYYDLGSTQCSAVNCESDTLDEAAKCHACSEKYWEDGECKDKIDCENNIISTTEQCSSCSTVAMPTHWDADEGKCHDCPEHCAECSGVGCDVCAADYTLENGMCVLCTDAELTEQASCEVCPGKFWAISNSCDDCPANCLSCSTSYVCEVCVHGMVWNAQASACVSCMNEDAESCVQCGTTTRGNYWTEDDEVCYACPVGCMVCDTDGCTECTTGYYLEEDACVACSDTMTTEQQCSVCGGSKRFWNSGTEACESCASGCETCSAPDTCDTCPAGTHKNAQSTCSNCAKDCLVCSSDTDCTYCESNKYFKDTECVNCPSNCAQCDNPEGCYRCVPGFYLAEGECKACISGCAECDDDVTCKRCSSGNCLDESKTECHSTSSSCYMCTKDADSNEISCTSCVDGHYLEECVACSVAGCVECRDAQDKCEKCAGGYYMDGTSCKACGSRCLECSDSTECDTCQAGTYKDNGECTACGNGCAQCDDADSCIQCSSSHTAWDDDAKECKACVDDCAECSGPDSCRTCVSGYYVSEGECAECPENCHKCQTEGECDECQHSYYKDSAGVCTECAETFPFCASCTSAGSCDMCASGYALKDDGTECLECSISKCGLCADIPPYCEQCAADYYPTPDMDHCEPGCYTCEGEGCDVVTANMTVEACHSLGTDHYCETLRREEDGEIEYSRSCSNATECSMAEAEYCQDVEGVKECRVCCSTGKCNTAKLTGETASARAGSTAVPATTLLTMLITSVLLLLHRQ